MYVKTSKNGVCDLKGRDLSSRIDFLPWQSPKMVGEENTEVYDTRIAFFSDQSSVMT